MSVDICIVYRSQWKTKRAFSQYCGFHQLLCYTIFIVSTSRADESHSVRWKLLYLFTRIVGVAPLLCGYTLSNSSSTYMVFASDSFWLIRESVKSKTSLHLCYTLWSVPGDHFVFISKSYLFPFYCYFHNIHTNILPFSTFFIIPFYFALYVIYSYSSQPQ